MQLHLVIRFLANDDQNYKIDITILLILAL